MLATANRMRSREEFQATLRRGRRVSSKNLTGFILTTNSNEPTRFGFQVSKRIGGSVQRHRVARQLRHLASPWVPKAPYSTLIVIRPESQQTRYEQDFDLLMSALITKANTRNEVRQ